MAARDPFTSPFVGEDPIARARRKQQRRQNWQNTVLRRQRILKANGFNVVVDGNWGKRTSSAWWRYKRGMAPLAGTPAPAPNPVGARGDVASERARVFKDTTGRAPDQKPPKPPLPKSPITRAREIARRPKPQLPQLVAGRALANLPARRPTVPQDAPAPKEVPTARDLQKVRAEVIRGINVDAQARFERAWKKKETPEKWDSRDIVSLLADPATQVRDWHKKPVWVEKVQRWLRAHGALIPVTGRWDAYTADAFKAEMLRRKKNYERWRGNQLAKRIYAPLGIKPGQKGFPLLGTAPTPQRLLEILDAGGFTATEMLRQLTERFKDIQLEKAWRTQQDEFLDSLLVGGPVTPEAASAFGPFLSPMMLDQMTPAQKYAAILLAFSARGVETDNDWRKKGDTFYQEVRAIANATSQEDLKGRVQFIRAADEKHFQISQAIKAENDNLFFNAAKSVVHALGVPAEETQDAIAGMWGAVDALLDPDTYEEALDRPGGPNLEDFSNDVIQEVDRSVALAQASWAQWEKDHAVLGFFVDLGVDPLNAIPATWIGDIWKGTKSGVRAVESGGKIIRAAGSEMPLPLRLVGDVAGTTLQLPAAYGRGLGAAGVATKSAIKQSNIGRLGRAVKENVDDVTRTVKTAFGAGFKASDAGDAADVAAVKDGVRDKLKGVIVEDPTTGRKFNLLDELDALGVRVEEEIAPLITDFIVTSSRNRLSLYTHQNRLTPSDWGASSRATLASFSWSMHADTLAAKAAKEEHDRILDSIDAALLGNADYRAKTRAVKEAVDAKDDEAIDRALGAWNDVDRAAALQANRPSRDRHVPTISTPLNEPITHAEHEEMIEGIAKAAGERVYKQQMKESGSYLGGATFEKAQQLEKMVFETLDLWDNVIAPAVQNAIEKSLAAHGAKMLAEGARSSKWVPPTLWAKDGSYAVGNRAKSTEILRDILRETFDDLDEKYGPALERATDLPSVRKYRAARMEEINADFAERELALKEATEKAAEHQKEAKLVFQGDFPILINKQDRSVIFGGRNVDVILGDPEKAKDYFLAQARLGGTNKVQSISEKIVDLETGELRYDPADFVDTDTVTVVERGQEITRPRSDDPKFRKAIDDLKRLDKRIAEMQKRKREAGRVQDLTLRAEAWTTRDQMDLNNLRAAKRRLIKTNPASKTYFVRGAAKKAVQRQVDDLIRPGAAEDFTKRRAALAEEKNEAIREMDQEVRDLAASMADTRKRSVIDVENADVDRVFTQDEYDRFQAMMYERRVRSVHQWAARRRAVGDMTGEAIDRAVLKELDEWQMKVSSWFEPQRGGTYKMTAKRIPVPAIYARHHYRAYDDALKGRHPILQASDVPDHVKSVLSIAAPPAEKLDGSVKAMERMAALLTGARPYPVYKKFQNAPGTNVVKGRKVTFEPRRVGSVGVPQGTRMAQQIADWQDKVATMKAGGWTHQAYGGGEFPNFVRRFDAYHGLLKVAAQHAYPRVSKSQWAWARALKEAQSGPLRTISTLLDLSREMFVFSVLPLRPAATVRNVVDSVAKILVMGMHDPRYWIAGGLTKGEQQARQELAEVSKGFKGLLASKYEPPAFVDNYKSKLDEVEQTIRDAWDNSAFGQKQRELLETVTNVFQLGVNDLEIAIKLLAGPKYGDAIAARFRHVFNTAFWARPLADVRKMLAVNGVDVPDEVVFGIQTILKDGQASKLLPREKLSLEDWAAINKVKTEDVEDWIKMVTSDPKRLNDLSHPVAHLLSHTADVTWDLMVGRVEGFLRRGLYRSEYAKSMKRQGDSVRAHADALKAVDDSLFDYSKLTTLEENFRHVAPFLFFWRRNLAFWATQAIQKPYLPAALVKFDQMMENANSDQPEWSRRYVRVPMLNDALAKLPVANWVFGENGFEVGFDPLSYLSAAPLYRAFRGENPTLPADRAGLPFISQLVEGINSFGLTFSPWFRKPLELSGVLDYRAYQTMFPQTGVVDVLSERFLKEMFPDGLNFEETLQDSLFEAIGVSFSAKELNDKRINEFVQLEMAAQAKRGEPVDREAAEEKVRKFIYLQTIFAFSVGTYLRHLDPAQLELYRIQSQLVEGELDFRNLSERDQRAYRLFIKRKMNPGAFNEYLHAVPKIEAYHAFEDYDEAQRYLQENPEVIPHVVKAYTKKAAFTPKALRNTSLAMDTDATINTLKAIDAIDIDGPVRDSLQRHFVTKELEAFWAKNDTAKQQRDKMLRGEAHRYLRDLRNDYFALPDGDHEAKRQFLQDNPILAHSFTVNERASDDLLDVLNYVNADLREVYFEHVDRGDWDGAAEFLKRFPRIFEMTKAEDRVTDDGTWLPAKKGSQHAKDYVAAQRHIQHYFQLKEQNKKLAYKWLQGSTPGAKIVREYFKKYADPTKGTKSEHARAYVAMKPTLSWFFDALPEKGEFRGFESKWEWVFESSDPRAVRLRDYFRKYGDKAGMTKQAKDYVAVKDEMQHYFDLKEKDPRAANDWLHSDAGAGVLSYFKTYGKTNAAARKWGKWVRSQNPEVNRRLVFWKRYFELEPSQRPGFVHREAEKHGVFMWGVDETKARWEKESEYLRSAKKRHLTKKQAMYLKVAPLLELMHTLDDRDTKILLRLNPDLREYLDTYSKGPDTGDKVLDRKLKTYFDFDPDSPERSVFLEKNPDVQRYFDEKNPADAAIHRLLEVYFKIEDRRERSQFRDLHPEIGDYFDRKREEETNLRDELRVFDDADPRDDELRERAEFEIVAAAEAMWAKLRHDGARRLAGDEIEVRRERRTRSTSR